MVVHLGWTGVGGGRGRIAPRCAHLHPAGQNIDLRLGQLALGRHLQIFVANRAEQRAVGPIRFIDNRAAVPAAKRGFARGQVQPAFQLVSGARRVARMAMCPQDRQNLGVEEACTFGGCLRRRGIIVGPQFDNGEERP